MYKKGQVKRMLSVVLALLMIFTCVISSSAAGITNNGKGTNQEAGSSQTSKLTDMSANSEIQKYLYDINKKGLKPSLNDLTQKGKGTVQFSPVKNKLIAPQSNAVQEKKSGTSVGSSVIPGVMAGSNNIKYDKQVKSDPEAEKIKLIKPKSQGKDVEPKIKPGKVLAKFKNNASDKNKSKALGKIKGNVGKALGKSGIVTIEIPKDKDVKEAVKELKKDEAIEFVEPVYRVEALASTELNDPYYVKNQQWGLNAIMPDDAWADVPVENRQNVTIAVIDSGVDLEHPDLAQNILPGYDFVNEDNIADDDFGHGTHVAGIAAAIENNNTGIAGVAGGAKILPVKVLDQYGRGWSDDVIAGINYAVDNGAQIINMSLGSPFYSQLEYEAINRAINSGVTVIAATGNDYGSPVSYPAAYEGVIGVSSVNWNSYDGFTRSFFANKGEGVDICAPGEKITSTVPQELDTPLHYMETGIGDAVADGYTYLSGTSMATPFVAGMAALLKAADPSLTPAQIQQKLESAAVDLGAPGKDWDFGAGILSGDKEKLLPSSIELPHASLWPFEGENWNTINLHVQFSTVMGELDHTVNGNFDVMAGKVQMCYGSVTWLETPRKLTEITVTNGIGDTSVTFNETGDYLFFLSGASNPAADRFYMDTISSCYVGLPVKGTMFLPGGDVSPVGGIEVLIIADGTKGWGLLYSMNIPEGMNSADFELRLKADDVYNLTYILLSQPEPYVPVGYYGEEGTVYKRQDIYPVGVGTEPLTGINFNVLKKADLPDDYSNYAAGAAQIEMNTMKSGAINYGGDVDFFKFTVTEPAKYSIKSKSLNNTCGELYLEKLDENGNPVADESNLIAADRNDMYFDYNFKIITELQPGNYYIRTNYLFMNLDGEYSIALANEDMKNVPVSFADGGMERAVRNCLGKVNGETVTIADMESIEGLNADFYDISSLEDLKYAVNLRSLSVQGNKIKDLTPLSTLANLGSISANYNAIESIDALGSLTNLTNLFISDNLVQDISVVAGMKNMFALDIFNNPLSSVDVIANLNNLDYLRLSCKNPFDAALLDNLNNLYALMIENTQVLNPEWIGKKSGIEYLSLSNTGITDISFMSSMKGLRSLEVSFNDIKDFSVVKSMSNLNSFGAGFCGITDLEFLRDKTELQYVHIPNNNFTDLSPLGGKTSLWYVNITNNNLTDISVLKDSVNLELIFIDYNKISDISTLSAFTKAGLLCLNYNNISDFRPVRNIYPNLYWKDFTMPPEALDVSITGDLMAGSTVNGNYLYNDMDGDAEAGTAYRWLICDTVDGVYKPIEGAAQSSYKITAENAGKYIRFEVTPKNSKDIFNDAPVSGVAVVSETFGPVLSANQPPEFTSLGFTITEGFLLSFQLNATDLDGDTLSYSADVLPEGASFNSTLGIFTWKPNFRQAGTYNIKFTVSDGHLTDSENVVITVKDMSPKKLTRYAIEAVKTMKLENGIENKVLNMLWSVEKDLDKGNTKQAAGKVEQFIKSLQKHEEKKLTAAQEKELLELAQSLLEAISNK